MNEAKEVKEVNEGKDSDGEAVARPSPRSYWRLISFTPHLSPSLPLLLKDPMPAHWYAVLTAVVSAGVQFVLFLRWLHRRMRNDEITRAFVRDIATNHLPHIYNALQKIAAEQGIELDDTPLVRFVDLNGHRHHK